MSYARCQIRLHCIVPRRISKASGSSTNRNHAQRHHGNRRPVCSPLFQMRENEKRVGFFPSQFNWSNTSEHGNFARRGNHALVLVKRCCICQYLAHHSSDVSRQHRREREGENRTRFTRLRAFRLEQSVGDSALPPVLRTRGNQFSSLLSKAREET